MARIKMAHVVSEVKGSVGGTVFANYRGQAYIKAKTSPVHKDSISQTLKRSLERNMVQFWREQTQEFRDEWNAVAATAPFQNRFGDTVYLTGLQLYTKCLYNIPILSTAFAARFFVNGTKFNPKTFTIGVNNGFNFFLAIWGKIANNFLSVMIDATPPLSAGRVPQEHMYKRIYTASGGNSTIANLAPGYKKIYGSLPQPGSKVGCRFRAGLFGAGILAQPLEAVTIAN